MFRNRSCLSVLSLYRKRIGDSGNDMSKKTEESRVAYNKMAFEYDMSREGQYTSFHISELTNMIDLSEGDVVLDVACGNGMLSKYEFSNKALLST